LPKQSYFSAAAVFCLLAVFSRPGSAQWLGYATHNVPKGPDGKPNMNAPTPRTGDGHVDFSGMWGWETRDNCLGKCTDTQISREFINLAATLKGGVPYKPGVADMVKQRTRQQGADPNVHCMPRGNLRIITDDYYKRFFQESDRLLILTERNMQYRQIFTDGRDVPKDPNPTWNGYSVGKWEGDTLVVTTTGFRDDLWLDANGNPLSGTGKTIERFRRPIYGALEVEMTVEDPTYYTKPWTVTLHQPLIIDSELIDYFCLENEKDFVHMKEVVPGQVQVGNN
jgi:hypothetical protein